MKEDIREIKRIDIHAHANPFPQFAPYYPQGCRYVSPEEVVELYDKLNVEHGILLPLASAEGQYGMITSEDCAYGASMYPERLWWFCMVDPRMGEHSPTADLSKYLMHYKNLGAKGCGELISQMYLDHPMVDNLFYHCAACDMPVTIHLAPQIGGYYGVVDELGLPRLERALKKHKKLKILGHSQLFWAEISADITEEGRRGYPKGKISEPGRITQLLREYENLYCDLSAGSGANALKRDPDHAARFIEEFADRLLYGIDYTMTNNNHQTLLCDFLVEMTVNGYVSYENYYKIVRGNALRLFDIENNY